MNHDDYKPDLSTLIDPELEARIVAWVTGEASPFEAAELTRLTSEKPELAIFHRRIAAVSGLVGEAIRPDPAPLRLTPERRAKLLQALGAPEFKPNSAVNKNTVMLPLAAAKKKYRINRRWIYGLAACLAVGLFTMMSIPSFQKSREAKYKMLALPMPNSEPREPDVRDDLSVAENVDYRAQADGEKRREKAFKYAISEAEMRRKEREAKDDFLRARGAVEEQKKHQVARSKTERDTKQMADASSRQAGLIAGLAEQGVALPVPSPASAAPYDSYHLPSAGSGAESKSWGIVLHTPKSARQANVTRDINDSFGIGTDKKVDADAPSSRSFSYYANPAAPRLVESPQLGGKELSLNAVPSPAQAPIVLSPFEISATNDKGYAAQNTLAGTRVQTELKDASAAISVRTNQFLKDLSATNSQDLLRYSSATEVGGVRENFAPPQANEPMIMAGLDSRSAGESNGQTIDPNSTKDVFGDKQDQSLDGPKITVEGNADSINADPTPSRKPAQPPTQTFSEINARKEPVSTFSLHVSDVSFRLAQAALAKGESLDRASIRPEEFYNAFSYGDPTPALAEKVSCRIEQAAHPFVQQRNLVRIAVKVAAAGRDAAQPLHLTVLLDTSGSMEREDRSATIQSAMKALTSLLGPNDRLTLIGFSRQPRLLAESLSGDQAVQVLDLIKNTPAEGGTNLEEALKLGSELAHRQFEAGAQNRIVLLTDGAANLGNANPAQLAASIEALRQQGIAFDACGVGLEGLDDGMLENLTRKGDGRYYVLNSPEAADAGFAKQLAGAFRPAAENVKLQVRFNPARVGNYRLIGFEQHRLKEEDFRNDKVDAAELAAEEAAVAVYQVEALPQGEGEIGEVYVRFRDAASGNMVERNWTLNYDAQAPAFDRATPSMQLAGTAALLAEKLQGGETAAGINLKDLAPVVAKLRSRYANEPRVQELVTMFEQARKLAGE